MGSLPAPWDGISCRRDARPASMGQAGLWQGGHAGRAGTRARGQVSQGVLTTVSGTSDAAAPFRLARHVTAGNVAPERSTARRLNSLPLIGAEPIARAASAFARRRSTSILGDVLERVVVDVGSSEFDTKPGAPTLRPTAVFLVAVSGAEHLLPFAGPAVVVAVHPPLIRTVATRDAVGMIAPQRRAVAVRSAPGSRRPRRRQRTCWRHAPAAGLAHHAVAVAVPHERIRRMVARHRCDPVRSSFRATDAAVPVIVPRGDCLGNAGRGRGRGRNLATRDIWSSASASRRSMVSP